MWFSCWFGKAQALVDRDPTVKQSDRDERQAVKRNERPKGLVTEHADGISDDDTVGRDRQRQREAKGTVPTRLFEVTIR